MTREELKTLAEKIKEGKATEVEKSDFIKELHAALEDTSQILGKAQKPRVVGASFEMPPSNPEPDNAEKEGNGELKEQFEELDNKAEEVGEQLENVDVSKLAPEEVSRINDNIERVLGGFYMLAGSAAGSYAWEALTDVSHHMDSIEKVIAAGVITLGLTAGVIGFDKLIFGAKKFFAELTPEQKEKASS